MIEAVLIGAVVIGLLVAIGEPVVRAMAKRDAYRLLAQADPSPKELHRVIGVLSRSKDAESQRLGDDLHAKLRQTHIS